MTNSSKKILFTGGGTLGSAMPLVAIYQELKKQNNFLFYWIGTHKGPEKKLIEFYKIPFKPIIAGKFRRYFSMRNILDIAKFKIGFFQSLLFLIKWHPHIILSAGGFVSVPVVIAGWLLKIPSIIHQQDIKIGLANKIMAKFAAKITVTFPEQIKDFSKNKVVITGNPVRKEIIRVRNQELGIGDNLINKFKLKKELPILLVIGGGTGAEQINELVWQALPELIKFCQIVHITGKHKNIKIQKHKNISNYRVFDFLTDELSGLLSISDVVVSRAGMSFLSELTILGKPIILIPMPNSHQELNAEYFKSKNAVEVLNFDYKITNKSVEQFKDAIVKLINNKQRQAELSQNIQKLISPNAVEKFAEVVMELLKI